MSSSSPSPPKNRDKSHRTVFKKRSIPLDISHLPKQTINKTEDEMMCNHVTTSSLIDSGVGDYVPKLINTYNSDLNNDSKKHEYEDQQTLICPFGDVLLNPGDNDDTHDIKNTGLDFNIVNEINTTIIISKENVKGKSNATYSNVSENDEPSHRNMLLSRTNLYIKGLSKITTDKDLLDLCHRFGNIISTKAILDKETNLCKGFGFVDFEDADSAQTALKELRSSGSQVQMAKSLDSTNLYIANLPPHMQERDLEKMISPYGPVLSIRILKEMGNNLKSRGVGFARMESRSCCERVISNINGKIVEGSNKPLLCKFADNASHNNLNINYTNSIHNAQTNKSIQRNRLGQGTHHPLSNNPTFPGLNRSNYLFHNIEHIKNNLTNNNNQDIYYYPQSAQIYQPHLNHPPNTLAAGMGSNLNLNRNTYFNKQLFGRNSLYSDNGNKQQQYATLHQPQFYLTPQYLNPSINLNYGSPSALFYQPIPTNVKDFLPDDQSQLSQMALPPPLLTPSNTNNFPLIPSVSFPHNHLTHTHSLQNQMGQNITSNLNPSSPLVYYQPVIPFNQHPLANTNSNINVNTSNSSNLVNVMISSAIATFSSPLSLTSSVNATPLQPSNFSPFNLNHNVGHHHHVYQQNTQPQTQNPYINNHQMHQQFQALSLGQHNQFNSQMQQPFYYYYPPQYNQFGNVVGVGSGGGSMNTQNLQQHPQYQLNSPQTVPINSPILYYYYYPVVPPNAINSNSYASQNNQTPILNKLEESSDTFGVNEKIDNTPDDDQYIDKDVIASRTIQKIGDESIQKIEKNMGKEKNIDFNKIHAEGSTLADHKNYHSYYRFDLSLANTPAINSILEQNIINTSAHSKSLNSFSQTDNQKFLNRRFSKTLTSVNNSLKRDGNKVKDS
ncbi:putative uncharacterized protein DDB_G0282499 isoform X2 [Gordionus sp. m RMFG-2023]|uniref:putative uncharacterized protein DDB_G0282499 isoform X2 n=1 Tax=Gordionus sp. m RMFG-2023 TaxID=3053472 RepID=UPI0031FDD424